MGTINEVMGQDAAVGVEIKCGAETFTVMPSSKINQGEYEDWLIDRADTAAINSATNMRLKAQKLWEEARNAERAGDGEADSIKAQAYYEVQKSDHRRIRDRPERQSWRRPPTVTSAITTIKRLRGTTISTDPRASKL